MALAAVLHDASLKVVRSIRQVGLSRLDDLRRSCIYGFKGAVVSFERRSQPRTIITVVDRKRDVTRVRFCLTGMACESVLIIGAACGVMGHSLRDQYRVHEVNHQGYSLMAQRHMKSRMAVSHLSASPPDLIRQENWLLHFVHPNTSAIRSAHLLA